ncbi:MAG: chlorophyll a-b binding domain-containing protein, partial [Cyanobium sp. MAG_237]|nr:chlorophyll a-b binding domain-containing protein [Cyanobium sp. MAG_237]
MTNTASDDQMLDNSSDQLTLVQQLQRVERFNGRAAMLGIVIGIVVEG